MNIEHWLQLLSVTAPVLLGSLGYFIRPAVERAKARDAVTPPPVVDVVVPPAPVTTEERLVQALEDLGRARAETARLRERLRWMEQDPPPHHGTMG